MANLRAAFGPGFPRREVLMSKWTAKQTGYMKEALRLARQGWGLVSPNPMVGAVLVKRGRVLAKNWHSGPGQLHAEAAVLAEAGRKAAGAELYVNLEPCAHHGRTGPCVEAIIEAKVAKVFYSVPDPHAVAAGGARLLEDAGVEVDRGLLADEAWELNQFFFKWATTGVPFVILKTAASLDGKIATSSGDSRWISSKAARNFGHHIRAGVDAILIGRNTACKDDPELSARPWGRRKMHRQPRRVVLDPALKLPFDLKLFDPALGGPTTVVCAPEAPTAAKEELRRLGHVVMEAPKLPSGFLSLSTVVNELGQSGCQSVLIEPGATLASSALLEEPVVDLVHIFLAPMFLGGRDAPGLLGGPGLAALNLARAAEILKIGRKGPDVHIMVRPNGAFKPSDDARSPWQPEPPAAAQ
ncbi:MAG: bifunctional diaminohydroxyphosphoribosylaminopyrimidine deaminase/5-amino-6-(5-phosphoribosylamino)uracil reductase RibD [Deltaproteobacteria bacterium]|jgi:diaminohydroxyphosphoribosylaminopyrimidine deaminase/5-amino-6-(5-phosphoribosylamino)uracil reductase|nr:bifunctional diaminohydroxyphosphoribosylaminopyrimidine deaminase/5-amino-6-(5-phosphoribosylamino)uracil reductase RibD [Deltaproteobacteria bacterium]